MQSSSDNNNTSFNGGEVSTQQCLHAGSTLLQRSTQFNMLHAVDEGVSLHQRSPSSKNCRSTSRLQWVAAIFTIIFTFGSPDFKIITSLQRNHQSSHIHAASIIDTKSQQKITIQTDQQSCGWEHYDIHQSEPHIMLFRRHFNHQDPEAHIMLFRRPFNHQQNKQNRFIPTQAQIKLYRRQSLLQYEHSSRLRF